MPVEFKIKGQKATKGERMRGTGWHLATTNTRGRSRIFRGTLLSVHNLGAKRVAIFSVPK